MSAQSAPPSIVLVHCGFVDGSGRQGVHVADPAVVAAVIARAAAANRP
ncbi:hypothetical protein [Sphaerisporangium album]|nr:hypothetical protein [Sphaerisporangium album]